MSLESLKIILFWRIVEFNNIEILNVNHRKGRKYNDLQLTELANHWKQLYDQFYMLRNNKSGKYTIDKNSQLAELALKLNILADIENRLILLINMDGPKELSKFIAVRTNEAVSDFKKLYPKIRVNIFSNPLEVLTIVQSVIKAQINIYDEKVGVKQETITKQKETIYDVVAMMSKYLGYNLNVDNMSCMEFIGHENTINSMNKK